MRRMLLSSTNRLLQTRIWYSTAGLMRKFLVYPAAVIWPGNLVGTTLMYAMHERKEKLDPTVSPTLSIVCLRLPWLVYVLLDTRCFVHSS